MEIKDIINKLVTFEERQFENEIKARRFIENLLKENNLNYTLFEFETYVPKYIEVSLEVNGVSIECKPSGLISGEISNLNNLISSLNDSEEFVEIPNINFNPYCEAISRPNFYFAPSLAINVLDMNKIILNSEIKGILKVEKELHNTASILVGNLVNPKKLVFCHFDSLDCGVIDNASGVSVCLNTIIENSNLLDENLFVFDSNEELSYDKPIYWGHGYREFEEKYSNLIENVQKILVVDCVGYSQNNINYDEELIKLAFPIKRLNEFINKINLLCGDYQSLMKVYHSSLDNGDELKDELLKDAQDKLINYLIN